MVEENSKGKKSRWVMGGRVQIPLRVTTEEREEIERRAQQDGVSISEWTYRAIHHKLEEQHA